MSEMNDRQAEFYESRLRAIAEGSDSEEAAGIVTNLWTKIRKNIQTFDEHLQLDEKYNNLHREWVRGHDNGTTIDLGCFSGNPLSFELAASAASYTGVDLSPSAIASLQSELSAQGLNHAHAVARDFFELSLPDDSVDLVYARGVLHHFPDTERIATEVRRVLKPGGVCVSLDPLATAPENRVARALYRPLQSDADWEFPFTNKSLKILSDYFDFSEVRGIRGLSRGGLLLSALGLRGPAELVGKRGDLLDERFASKNGVYLRLTCWNVMLKLQKKQAR